MSSLHVKVVRMKNFAKSFDNDSEAFWYLCNKFQELNYENVKLCVFIGPQIRKLLAHTYFQGLLNDNERNIWITSRLVLANFL